MFGHGILSSSGVTTALVLLLAATNIAPGHCLPSSDHEGHPPYTFDRLRRAEAQRRAYSAPPPADIHPHGRRDNITPSVIEGSSIFGTAQFGHIFSVGVLDDHTCGPGRPCGNQACCGAEGFCGYGDDYCGEGCTSNCDAVAECGKYADPPGQECPLNVCCSQHGFCGTTQDFCGTDCQSNCVMNPKPPGGSSKGRTLSKVIGYYEAWNARSKCHSMQPKDLPLKGLTHLNYAFAFIHPTSFEITTMDAATPGSLFNDVADLKIDYPQLELYLSIGGWTFSDNDTITQPIFGNIARSAANRKTFASNIIKFLNTYNFDGVDIDWEYPGAGDRGGSDEDVSNFVLLFKDIREAFDRSGQKFGLTFTIPSSFWYLRWFDMPGLLKYADWANLMSYDLHGIWDSNNPIGSQVLAHTNLTEIGLASELLWRVGIKPHQLALGFGFYGRAFTLEDPGCTKPGCPFEGGAKPGPCTNTSGYLAYYEVQDILKKNPGVKVIHDEEAAVKYMSWDTDQWISFDDEETFKQKVDWANQVGFSGSLIWASDLDDFEFTAHSALTGKDLTPILKPAGGKDVKPWQYDNELMGKCYRQDDCRDMDNPQASSCGAGYTSVGFDARKCNWKDQDGRRYGKRICCPSKTLPEYCLWRGNTPQCNGQCHPGEVTLFDSRCGGKTHRGNRKDENDTRMCHAGHKVFCCESSAFTSLTETCRWTGCGQKCGSGETKVADALGLHEKCDRRNPGMEYCCKLNGLPTPLRNCHWVGQGGCADNTCSDTEVTLETDNVGDNGLTACWLNRKKSLCCTPNEDYLEDSSATMCSGKSSDPGSAESVFQKRSEEDWDEYTGDDGEYTWYGEDIEEDVYDENGHFLEKRKGARSEILQLPAVGLKSQITLLSSTYKSAPAFLNWMANQGGKVKPVAYQMAKDLCTVSKIQRLNPLDLLRDRAFPQGNILNFATEHPFEIDVMNRFMQTCITGVLPSKSIANTEPINQFALLNAWTREADPGQLLPIGDNPMNIPLTLNDRLYGILGGNANPTSLVFLQGSLNRKKEALFLGTKMFSERAIRKIVKQVETGELWRASPKSKLLFPPDEALLEEFRQASHIIATFDYMNDDVMIVILRTISAYILRETGIAETVYGVARMQSMWREFEADLFPFLIHTAQTNFATLTNYAVNKVAKSSASKAMIKKLTNELEELALQKGSLTFDFLKT